MICHYDECDVLFSIMLNVIMLSVIRLSVIMLSVIMLSVIMLSVIMLNAVMLSVIMPSVFVGIWVRLRAHFILEPPERFFTYVVSGLTNEH